MVQTLQYIKQGKMIGGFQCVVLTVPKVIYWLGFFPSVNFSNKVSEIPFKPKSKV